MLMHRVTFSTPARVSLDAAGVLTEGAAETAGEIPKIPAHPLFLLLLPHPFFKMNKRVKAVGGGRRRVEMLSPGLYHKLAG